MVGLKCGSGRRRAGEDTRPYGAPGKASVFAQGPVPDRPAGAHCAPLRLKRSALITRTFSLIRHGFAVPPSPTGEGLGAATGGRPYGENRAGSVGSANSGADVGPQQLPFFSRPVCAPEMFCPLQGVTPVTGVRGKGEYGHAVSILSRPPAILWFLSHRWERNSPRRANPPAYNNPNPKPAPSSVTASPCHLSLSPLAFGHLPLIRGVGPQGEGL